MLRSLPASAALVALATTATVLALAPSALGAPATGRARLTIGGDAAHVLRTAGVKVAARAPATGSSTLSFPISTGKVAKHATLELNGALRLSARSRALTITRLRLQTGARTTITGLVAERRTTILVRAGRATRPRVDAETGDVALSRASWRLTARAATAIRARLRLARLSAGTFATGMVTATVTPASSTGSGTAPAPPSSGTSTTPSAGGPPTAACNAVTQRVEPQVLARPGSAVGVAPLSITWHVRESFVDYIRTGEGVTALDGATAGATPYDFHFTPQPSGSWRDPVSGTALLRYTGTVRFRYSAHGIDIRAKDPEVEINGAASRIILTIESADSANKRAVLANLTPTPSYADMPGTVPAGAEGSELAGFYCPGTAFGSTSVTF